MDVVHTGYAPGVRGHRVPCRPRRATTWEYETLGSQVGIGACIRGGSLQQATPFPGRTTMEIPAPRTPLVFRAYSTSLSALTAFGNLLTGAFRGVWLGILTQRQLELMDALHHMGWSAGGFQPIDYSRTTYNNRGLWVWERELVTRFFSNQRPILLLAAGAGRELLALTRMGYQVDAYECNPELVAHGNRILREQGLNCTIRSIGRDECPAGPRCYGGAIVGWSAYMLIPGRERRIRLLRTIATRLEPESPLLISFFGVTSHGLEQRATYYVGNILRTLLRRPRLDLGDSLAPTFVHYFTREEIEGELAAAGFRLEAHSITGYGRAVARLIVTEDAPDAAPRHVGVEMRQGPA